MFERAFSVFNNHKIPLILMNGVGYWMKLGTVCKQYYFVSLFLPRNSLTT